MTKKFCNECFLELDEWMSSCPECSPVEDDAVNVYLFRAEDEGKSWEWVPSPYKPYKEEV